MLGDAPRLLHDFELRSLMFRMGVTRIPISARHIPARTTRSNAATSALPEEESATGTFVSLVRVSIFMLFSFFL
jgi:hypothetical protein